MLPKLDDHIFIGDKKSSMYTIDIDRGTIVSKHTSNEDDDMLARRPIQSQNLLTVIRIDYTLTSINQKERNRSWNMTVSEVMAIQKGTKSEIAIKSNSELGIVNSNLPEKLNHIISNTENPIVSIHKYIKDQNMPIKIYDQKGKDNLSNFYDFYEECDMTINTDKDYYKIFSSFLKKSAENFKTANVLKPKSIFHLLALKFYEMYYLDRHFLLYTSIIFTLLFLVVVLIYTVFRFVRKNNDLKTKLDTYRNLSDDKKETASDSPTKKSIILNDIIDDIKGDESISEPKELCVYEKKVMLSDLIKFDPNMLIRNPLLPIDEKLREFEKDNIAMFQVNVKEDEDGSLIKEEYTTRRTRYENNNIVQATFKQIESHVNKMNEEFSVNDSDVGRGRKKTFDYENYINQNVDEHHRAKSKEITLPGRFESGFALQTYQNRDETKLILKKTRSINDDIEIVPDSPDNRNEKLKSPSQAIQLYNKRKYNFKEYCRLPQANTNMLINTTYIDEGRLEKNFEGFEKIGQGGFGLVFKAKHKIDDSLYAIKMVKLKVAQSHNLMEYKEIKEVRTMMKLNHKNVVRYYTCWFQLMINGLTEFSKDIESEANTLTQSHLKSLSKTYNTLYKLKKKANQSLNKIVENNESKASAWNWDGHNVKIIEEEKSVSRSAWNWHTEESKTKKTGSIVFHSNESEEGKAISLSFEKVDDSSEKIHEKYANDDSIISTQKAYKRKEQLYDVYFFMQMEYCDGLPLNQYLETQKETGIDNKIIFSFFKQIVSGVNHIHKNHVIHRDLK
jgi:hypothetical protein